MIKVLVVDDEPASAEYLSSIIARRMPQLQVVGVAENGAEALHIQRQTQADIVVTDIYMPRLDGLALAGALREAWPDTRCVIVSGYQDFDYARSAIHHGVSDYLLKPVKPDELVACLTRLVRAQPAAPASAAPAPSTSPAPAPSTSPAPAPSTPPAPAPAPASAAPAPPAPPAPDKEAADPARADFENLCDYLKRHLDKPLTLPLLCKRMGMSQTAISRLFRRFAGCSFVEYLTNARMESAKRLILSKPERMFKDVAASVGYADPLYFSRVFRAHTGFSPSEYARCAKDERL
ncbi:MAG: response regulator [Clostridia bacterium]